jgi:Mn2+/Fe2+ NRAMP family transporter
MSELLGVRCSMDYIFSIIILFVVIITTIIFIVLSLKEAKDKKMINKNVALMLFIGVVVFVSIMFLFRTNALVKYLTTRPSIDETGDVKDMIIAGNIDAVIKYVFSTAEYVILLLLSIFCLKNVNNYVEEEKSSL